MSYFGHRLEIAGKSVRRWREVRVYERSTTKLCVKLPTIAQRAKIVFCANHVKQAVHARNRMGLFEVYKKALMEKGKAVRAR